jgi:lipoprotein-anchoring transpeptidase ErfK/SrfK
MRFPALKAAFAAVLFGGTVAMAPSAGATVLVVIHKSSQRMIVSVNGKVTHTFPVSTGRRGYGTPPGVFRPQRLEAKWFSREYYNAPMPHAIFFHGGFAIHGSYEIRRLGGPASHGCVRLRPSNASILFGLVQRQGMRNTRIVVTR